MATKIQINKFKKEIKIEKRHPGTYWVDGGSYSPGKSEHATSTAWKECPCCGVKTEVYIWSLAGGGKACPGCGVLLCSRGAFIELKRMTKQDLIDFINFQQESKQKTKFICIETTDPIGFQEMSAMIKEINDLVIAYSAKYVVKYHFK